MRRAIVVGALVSLLSASAATAAAPVITPVITGKTGDGDWYVGDVIVNWTITPAGYLVDRGCVATAVRTDTPARRSSARLRLAQTAPRRASPSAWTRLRPS